MTIARGAALGSLVLAVIAVAVVIFGSGGGTEYTVRLQTANQLVEGNEVKVGGLAVGQVKTIALSEDNQADVKIEIDESFGPLRQGTKAVVRTTSLPSIANRYISLEPGPNNAPEIREGGILELDQTTNAVDLDQLFNTLDPKTRKGLQGVIQGFGGWYAGQSENTNLAYKYLAPSLNSVSQLTRELTRDQEVFTRLIVNGARATGAIAERRDDFAALVRNGDAFAAAIASENSSFDQALAALPSTLRNGTAAFTSLTETIPALNELTNVSKPAIKGLPEYLNSLGTLFATMQRPFQDLSEIVRTPGPGNDATDTLEQMPSLERQARTSVSNQIKALKRGQPIVEFLRPYAPDLAAWITHFSQVPAYYDANGNYARVLPIFEAFDYDSPTNTVNALSPANRKTDLSTVGSRFCPGAATQPATDGSNPFLDDGRLGFDDCDPSDIPPP